MTENELQQAYEELKSSYNYHDHRPQTRQGQEMLKQDEERFIDEALLPYLKHIAENFTSVLRNPTTLRLTISSNGGSIKAERIPVKAQVMPRRDTSGLKIVLPDGKTIQEQSATESMCAAIQYAISIFGIKAVLDAMERSSIICDGEPLLKNGPHNHPSSNSKPIGNNCFVNVHMNTKTKKEKLEQIGKAMNIPWNIIII